MLQFPKVPFKKIIFWFIVFWLAFRLLFSCTPIKRLQRFQTKYPYLFTAKTDTITVKDTFTVHFPGTKTDTIIAYNDLQDTVYINKNQLHIKLVKLPGDSIYVAGKVDTVYKQVERTIKVPYTKYETPKVASNWWKWLFWLLVTGAVTFVSYKYFSTKDKD